MAKKKAPTYDTELSADDEAAYKAWAQANDRARDEVDYDMRGWWKENQPGDSSPDRAKNEHFPDTYKKPTHPTFSKESKYHGVDGHEGGEWGGDDERPTFKPGKTNIKNFSRDDLQALFARDNPNGELLWPKSRAEKRYGKQ